MKVEKAQKMINILQNVYGCDTLNDAKKVLNNKQNKENIYKLLEQ